MKKIILKIIAFTMFFICPLAACNDNSSSVDNSSSNGDSISSDSSIEIPDSSSSNDSSSSEIFNYYTITWVNYDDTVLEVDNDVKEGTLPTYDGDTPTKEKDAENTYSFVGWTPEVKAATENTTYKAKFEANINSYTVTWKNYDGTVLETDVNVDYGMIPTYSGDAPTKESDAQYTYEFAGWTPEVKEVTENVTYTATFKSVLNKYTVTWVNYDDKVLEVDLNVEYGTLPTYDGEEPTRDGGAQYTYTFSGWDKTIEEVTGDVTYKATFTKTLNKYTVTWVNYDDTVLETDTNVEYGTMPTFDGEDPTRDGGAQYTYTFSGWDKTIEEVTGDVTYKAKFTETVNTYKVTWVNYDDTVLETDTNVEYGTLPTYDGDTPLKPKDAKNTYSFKGWTPEVSEVTGDVTYTAQFEANINSYTVTWANYDGTVLETDENVKYGTIPSYDGEAPTRDGGAQYTYTFNGWNKEIEEVTGNVTYAATFTKTLNKYTVTWKNYDGTVLETDTNVAYGTLPTFDGEDPTRDGGAKYTYAFSGWDKTIEEVTGNVTYTATFTKTLNKYTVTWVNYDDKAIEVDLNVEYGALPSYDGDTPTRDGGAKFTYTFIGWDKSIEEVTGDVTYKATYTETLNSYTVTWVNYDDTVLETDKNVKYGTIPSYNGDTPLRDGGAKYTYTFKGWNKAIEEVTGDITYKATFTETLNSYTVKWVNYDGTVLKTDTKVDYGTEVSYNGKNPSRATEYIGLNTREFTYIGWDSYDFEVTGDVTYTAQYNERYEEIIVYDIIDTNNLYVEISKGKDIDCRYELIIDRTVLIDGKEYLIVSIKENGFADCNNLSSIVLPNSINTIGKGAFKGCSYITSMTLPFIGGTETENGFLGYIFGGSNYSTNFDYVPQSLQNIKLTNDIHINTGAFYRCSSLKTIDLGDKVISIGDSAFINCIGLRELTIPNSVTTIGNSILMSCSNLESLTIPFVGTDRENNTFLGALFGAENYEQNINYVPTSLVTLNITNALTIVPFAFMDCTSLTSLSLNEEITTIGNDILKNCNSLMNLTVPFVGETQTTNEYLGYLFDSNLSNIDSVPTSLRKVEVLNDLNLSSDSFKNCSGLSEVIISEKTTRIYAGAFEDCYGLESITLPFVGESRNSANGAFGYIFKSSESGLTYSAAVPSNLRTVIILDADTIKQNAFENCNYINTIILNDTLQSIENFAFKECRSLSEIYIPRGVSNIGKGAFYGCELLSFIAVAPNNATYNSDEQCNAIIKTATGELIAGSNNTVITDKVMKIGDYAFAGLSSIEDIDIPNSVNEIGNNVFEGCTGLLTINIGYGVTSIGSGLLNNCTSLTEITIDNNNFKYKSINNTIVETATNKLLYGCKTSVVPNGIASIESDAFYGCINLSNIIIPSSVTNISDSAFYDCYGLKAVYYSGTKEQWSNISRGINNSALDSALVLYESNVISVEMMENENYVYLSDSNNEIVILRIKDKSVKSVDLSTDFVDNNIVGIALGAFDDCYLLKSITLPFVGGSEGDKQYLGYIFGAPSYEENGKYIPRSLGEVIVSDSASTISDHAFYGCFSLTNIVVSNSVTRIGYGSFEKCTSLHSITLPFVGESKTSNTYLGYVFGSASNNENNQNIPDGLKEVIITGSISSIGDYAFSGCSSLTNIVIPDSVTTIGKSAFENCMGLTSLALPTSVTSIGEYAFSGCTGLTSIKIPTSLTRIEAHSFEGCSGLESIVLPYGITSIGYRAFENCTDLTSVVIPDSVAEICSSAFENCHALTKIVIPDGVAIIYSNTFSECSSLTIISIPESVNVIDYAAFSYCSNLEVVYYSGTKDQWNSINFGDYNNELKESTIVYESKVTDFETIEQGKYRYVLDSNNNVVILECKDKTITSVDLSTEFGSSQVIAISKNVFSDCTGLTSVVIPTSVTSIGKGAFKGCTSLESITLPFVGENETNNAYLGYIFGANSYEENNKYVPSSLREVTVFGVLSKINNYAFYDCINLTRIVLPNSVNSIGYNAFWGCSSLTSMSIPNGVTSIELGTFYGCASLTSVVLPDSLTTIRESAFEGCTSLTDIVIPTGVTCIEESAFKGCKGITRIEIPNSVTSIGYGAFSVCLSLESITLPFVGRTETNDTYLGYIFGAYSYERNKQCVPSSLKEVAIIGSISTIGDYAFYDCSSITKIVVPSSVTYIADYAFYNCTSLINFDIPAGVTSIGEYAFYYCKGLTRIVIPEGVTSIGSSTFSYCTGLTSLEIPTNIKIIGDSAFSGCTGLTGVSLSNGLTSIGKYAFRGCTGLTKIVVPSSVTFVGNGAFKECAALESITLPFIGESETTNTYLGYIFGVNSYEIISDYVPSSLKEVIINSSLDEISYRSFYDCCWLTRIVLPESITTIEDEAFYGCTALTTLELPNGVTYIGNNAFRGCSNLTNIIIPNSVTAVGGYVFADCVGLTSIEIPTNLTTIGGYMFSGCLGLTNVVIPISVTSIGLGAFEGCTNLTSLTLPFIGESETTNTYLGHIFGYSSNYQSNNCVPSSLKEVIINGQLKEIGDKAFANCTGLTRIVLPESITIIGVNAFSNCSSLTSIVVPSSVTTIGMGAFEDCTALESITLPFVGESETTNTHLGYIFGFSTTSINSYDNYAPTNLKEVIITGSLDKLSDYAFLNCKTITSIVLPDSIKSIGSYAFYDCNALPSIVLPKGLTSIGEYSFFRCSSLTSIVLPKGVTTIGSYAFFNCERLTSIEIPVGVTILGSYAFRGCTSLTNLVLPYSLTSIGAYAFYNCTGLTSIEIPNGVTSIEEYAFYNCTGLTSVNISTGITSIGNNVFENCTSLTSIVIPNGITTIGNSAFSGCTSLISIIIPNSVTSISDYAFTGCSSLRVVYYRGTIEQWNAISVSYCNEDLTNASFVYESNVTSVELMENSTYRYLLDSNNKVVILECKDKTITTADLTNAFGSSKVIIVTRQAFLDCTSLTSVVLPDDLISLGNGAFKGCHCLTTVNIPTSITSIDNSTFEDCSSLTSIEIPDSITTIGNSAFRGCSSLTSIVIPSSVTSIRSNSFTGCTSLESITLPFVGESKTSNTYLGYLFGATSYEQNNQYVPSSLKEVTVGGTGCELGIYVFKNCTSLTKVVISEGVTSIGEYAFSGCTGLRNVVILNGVTKIGRDAFDNCSNLNSIVLPDSLTIVEDYAFSRCNKLYAAYYSGTESQWENITFNYGNNAVKSAIVIYNSTVTSAELIEDESYTYLLDSNNEVILIDCKDKITTSIDLTKGIGNNKIIKICDNAFYGLTNLTSVVIPDSVTWIGSSAFYGCTSLKSITLPFVGESKTSNTYLGYLFGATSYDKNNQYVPSSLKKVTVGGNIINSYTFYNCTSLTSVVMLEGITRIKEYAFTGCTNLSTVIIPTSVTNIETSAFSDCKGLKATYYNGTKDQWNNINIGYTNADLTSLIIYEANVSDLEVIETESFRYVLDSNNQIVLLKCMYNNLTSINLDTAFGDGKVIIICEYAFSNCAKLSHIFIPNTVTLICEDAFSGCSSLTNIVIPNSVTRIGCDAFYGCTSLQSITLPFVGESETSNTYLGYLFGASSYNQNNQYIPSSLIEVIISGSTSKIGDYAFYGCSSLTRVVISQGVTTIGNYAFCGCTGLTGINIPDSVTTIGNNAFSSCKGLISIVIPNSVTTIGDQLFSRCSNLTSVVLPEGITRIGSAIFGECKNLTSVVIPSSVTTIGHEAFAGCTSLTSIIIPKSVTSVEINAFSRCTGLTDIYVEQGAVTSGWNADWKIDCNATVHYDYIVPTDPQA